jgi:hypothetical protein
MFAILSLAGSLIAISGEPLADYLRCKKLLEAVSVQESSIQIEGRTYWLRKTSEEFKTLSDKGSNIVLEPVASSNFSHSIGTDLAIIVRVPKPESFRAELITAKRLEQIGGPKLFGVIELPDGRRGIIQKKINLATGDILLGTDKEDNFKQALLEFVISRWKTRGLLFNDLRPANVFYDPSQRGVDRIIPFDVHPRYPNESDTENLIITNYLEGFKEIFGHNGKFPSRGKIARHVREIGQIALDQSSLGNRKYLKTYLLWLGINLRH